MSDVSYTLKEAQSLVLKTLIRCKTSPENATSVANALIAAELSGQKGHGLNRLPSYAKQSLVGKVDGFAQPKCKQVSPGILAIDAALGFAYPALDLAITDLPAITTSQGIAMAAISRSHHSGMTSLVVERLATHGLISLMFANTPSAIAPWGGKTPLFGTNPIAIGVPRPDHDPIILDMSMSKVARGKILAAKIKGQPIPEGWALDAEGHPTTEPSKALQGSMLPMGEAKGAALVLMIELLAAGLTTSKFGFEASSFLDDKGQSPGTGQLIIAIDPTPLGGSAVLSRFETLAEMVEDEDGARLPGMSRAQIYRQNKNKPLLIPQSLLEEIDSIGL